MLNEKKLDWVLAIAVFLTATLVYFSTMAPTLAFWDCGELIAASYILGNPHPPGNPLLLLLWRAFIIVLPFAEVAARTNFLSVLSSALVATLAFLVILKAMRLLYPTGGLNRFAMYCGALAGGLLVAFSDTHWFSAVETETGGPAMLFVMLITWLSLFWYQHRGTPRADRLLLLIGYLGFLGVGVHLFAFIVVPVFVLLLLFDPGTRRNIPLLATGALLLSVIWDIGNFIFYAAGTLAACSLALMLTKNPEWRRRWTLSAVLSLVALLGFSSYAYVPIRSAANVAIDEGNLTSWAGVREYIERKQYGSESMIRRAFHRRAHLQHQILIHPHMGYGGYMLAQYFPWKVGDRDPESAEMVERSLFGRKVQFPALYETLAHKPGTQWVLFVLLQFPFLYGGWLAFRRNRTVGLYLLGLYAATSYGLVFYLNFADGTQMELRDYEYWKSAGFNAQQKPPPVHMEVRERDYFFQPGFNFMGVLFGVATVFLLDWIARRSRALMRPVGVALVALSFAVPVWSNYQEHDRSGDYVPYDYAYNLLNSCRPNSILFTNGDNDTFPLWFLQQVEGIRKDVRVVNLSLVNTNWYMHQLDRHEPTLKIGFTPAEIDALQPRAWPFRGPADIAIPGTKIRYQLDPLPYLRVQDIMVLHIVQNNYPERPVHFAVTIGSNNAMGLDRWTIMEGMVYTLVEEQRNREIDVAATARLVDSVYRFRGLGDPDVHIDNNTAGLLTNYSATHFRLASWAQDSLQRLVPRIERLQGAARAAAEAERDSLVAFAEKYLVLNARILPQEWRVHYYASQLYLQAGKTEKSDSALKAGMAMRGAGARIFAMNLAQSYLRQGRDAEAVEVLTEAATRSPDDIEIAFALSELHQRAGDLASALEAVSSWLRRNPKHEHARAVEQQLRQMEAQMRAMPPAEPEPAVPAIPE